MRRTLTLAIIVAMILLPELAEAQCAMCKAVVESSVENSANVFGGNSRIGEGLNKGIIILMIVPYVLLFLLFRKKIGAFIKEFSQAPG
jgi:hypothetical protein